MDKLEVFKWGIFESAITKSRLTYEPKVKTCFTCLRTRPVDDFSATKQKKSISHCKSCDRTGYRGRALKSDQSKNGLSEPYDADNDQLEFEKKEQIGRGLDAFDKKGVNLSECYDS